MNIIHILMFVTADGSPSFQSFDSIQYCTAFSPHRLVGSKFGVTSWCDMYGAKTINHRTYVYMIHCKEYYTATRARHAGGELF